MESVKVEKPLLLQEALNLKEYIIQCRRHLHMNPELSFEEYKTSEFVLEKLEDLGYEITAPIAKTGIVALLRGTEPGPTVALRADMDALPIQDEKTVPYASTVPKVAHLCGHDAHTSILLGAATILSKHRPQKGNIKLLFQPAEEGFGGARYMVEEGVLENPKVDAIAGLHVHPTAKTGTVTVAEDVAMACTDSFDIEVIGKGGHAAHPHMSVDSITVAAELVSSLQQIVSRSIDPLKPSVLTIGKIEGGFKRNIIAPSVRLEGTVRLLDPTLREVVAGRMEQYVKGICEAMGATYKLDYRYGYPSVKNDNSLIPLLSSVSDKILGEEKLTIVDPSMGGEDFAYYAEKVPGIFFRLGIYNEEKDCVYPNHHPKFDVDEDALPYGSAILAQFALEYIEEKTRETENL
ncbi:M20 metallopeptidase family protein [Planococcus salinus]|uniref:Amidohydrolase n=1 Tax=Planococcus salinus TaxID=1848460 RepID=A0A3M8P946_9BACL|nr:M20 family metallopeptidase [Planococcus salinus]RNF40188.1 amidohydrolase [Planococcus salinus]